MRLESGFYRAEGWVWPAIGPTALPTAQLVLVFGAKQVLLQDNVFDALRSRYPQAQLVAASTAGEILGAHVQDDSAVATAVCLERGTVQAVSTHIGKHGNSFEAGAWLMEQLGQQPELQTVFVLSDGALVNGSELAAGLNAHGQGIAIAGGLAGDAARFEQTLVAHNGPAEPGLVVAIGFYGKAIQFGHGSFGGWDEFGPERTITRSDKNRLLEIDGRPALELYKTYLGPYAAELPGSALLFPLALREVGKPERLVRTILNLSEQDGSMVFAGNMPEGSTVRLMKASFDKLITAAGIAASQANGHMAGQGPNQLAILVSCVGRKLVLQERAEDEVAAVRQALRPDTHTIGFYSYGEISPYQNELQTCDLHNQTMTITLLREAL